MIWRLDLLEIQEHCDISVKVVSNYFKATGGGSEVDFEILRYCCRARSKFSNAFVLTENKVSYLKISRVEF